ncbi:MAG: hypothetical protein ABIE68_00740 [bacterium]
MNIRQRFERVFRILVDVPNSVEQWLGWMVFLEIFPFYCVCMIIPLLLLKSVSGDVLSTVWLVSMIVMITVFWIVVGTGQYNKRLATYYKQKKEDTGKSMNNETG